MITFDDKIKDILDTQNNIKSYMNNTVKIRPITESEHEAGVEGQVKEPIDSFFGNVLKIVGVKVKEKKHDRQTRKKCSKK